MSYRLGITGGIGSGKSGVSELMRTMGIPVYDCDREAKRLMNCDATIREALIQLAGKEVYAADGTLDRRYLAAFMFGNDQHVASVNAIVHPAVRADFRRWCEANAKADVIALESAILFEAGMKADVDGVALVTAPMEERIARTMARDGSTREQVTARISSQTTDEERMPLADFIIHNAEDDAITPQVQDILQVIKATSTLSH